MRSRHTFARITRAVTLEPIGADANVLDLWITGSLEATLSKKLRAAVPWIDARFPMARLSPDERFLLTGGGTAKALEHVVFDRSGNVLHRGPLYVGLTWVGQHDLFAIDGPWIVRGDGSTPAPLARIGRVPALKQPQCAPQYEDICPHANAFAYDDTLSHALVSDVGSEVYGLHNVRVYDFASKTETPLFEERAFEHLAADRVCSWDSTNDDRVLLCSVPPWTSVEPLMHARSEALPIVGSEHRIVVSVDGELHVFEFEKRTEHVFSEIHGLESMTLLGDRKTLFLRFGNKRRAVVDLDGETWSELSAWIPDEYKDQSPTMPERYEDPPLYVLPGPPFRALVMGGGVDDHALLPNHRSSLLLELR